MRLGSRGAVVLCCGLASALAGPGASAGLSIDATWVGDPGGFWFVDQNWSPVGAPNNGAFSYNVFIPNDALPTLSQTTLIDRLEIGPGTILTVTGSSTDLRLASSAQPSNDFFGLIDNDGTIFLVGGDITHLEAGEWLTLRSSSGAGRVVISNSSGGRVLSNEPGGGVYQELGHRIEGSGNVGAGDAVLVNFGEIVANNNNPMEVDPVNTTPMVNGGLMGAEEGATLRLWNGTYDNEGGVIVAQDGSSVDFNGQSFGSIALSGGLIQSLGSGAIEMQGDVALTNVDLDCLFNVNSGDGLSIFGDIHNTGELALSASSGSAFLGVGDPVNLTGGGVLSLAGNCFVLETGPGQTGVLINVDNTITGTGNLGDGSVVIHNQSLILADGSEALDILPAGSPASSNSGTIRAQDSATILIQGGTLENGAGLIEAVGSGGVEFFNTNIEGGLITAGPAASLTATISSFTGVTLDGTLTIPNATDAFLGASLNNMGSVRVNGLGNFTDLVILNEVELVGGGEVVLNSDQSRVSGNGPSPHLLNVDNTIRGRGNVGTSNLPITNQGTIRAEGDGQTLVVHPNQLLTNTGVMEASGGATLALANGEDYVNNGGIIIARDGSGVQIGQFSHVTGGVLQTEGSGVIGPSGSIDLTSVSNEGTFLISGQSVTVTESLGNTGSIDIVSSGGLVANGVVTLSGGGSIHGNSTAAFLSGNGTFSDSLLINDGNTISGSMSIGSNATSFINRGTIIADGAQGMSFDPASGGPTPGFFNEGSIAAIAANGILITGGKFENAGDVWIAPSSKITREQDDYIQTAGSTAIDGTLTVNNTNGTLVSALGAVSGIGSVNGHISSADLVSPGSPAGVLDVSRSYTQQPSGSLRAVFDTDDSALGRLSVGEGADLSGTFVFKLTGNGLPNPFDLDGQAVLTASTLGGTVFDAALFDGLPGGAFLTLDYNDAGDGVASVNLAVQTLQQLIGVDPGQEQQVGAIPVGVVVADFDQANGDDVALSLPGTPGSVAVLLSAGVDGGGQWAGFEQVQVLVVGDEPRGLDAADLDSDGDADLAVALQGEAAVRLLLNDSTGIFSVDAMLPTLPVGSSPADVALADFDGDGDADLAAANAGPDSLTLYENLGGGAGFSVLPSVTLPVGSVPSEVTSADFEGDGFPELIVALAAGDAVAVVPNDAGGFSPPQLIQLLAGSSPGSLEPGDLDEDKDIDIVLVNTGAGSIGIIPSMGGADFGAPLNLPIADGAGDGALIDLDADNDLDFAVIANDDETGEPVVRIVRNDGNLNFTVDSEPAVVGTPLFLVNGDVDDDGDSDLVTISQAAAGPENAAGAPGIASALVNSLITPTPACEGDLTGDGQVDSADLNVVLVAFGQTDGGDVDGDGDTDSTDLNLLLAAFGDPC